MKRTLKFTLMLVGVIMMTACSGNKSEENHEGHDHEHHEQAQTGKSKSPRQAAMANIGSAHVHMDYSAPSVRGRQIFGGLVAFDEVWVTGAHSATSISVSEDVSLDGQLLPKGKYALFTIPSAEEWTVIINNNWDQHLADEYDEKDDFFRIKVKPTELDSPVEQLEFKVEDAGSGMGTIRFAWDKFSFSLPVTAAGK
jgi:hypothetical protein